MEWVAAAFQPLFLINPLLLFHPPSPPLSLLHYSSTLCCTGAGKRGRRGKGERREGTQVLQLKAPLALVKEEEEERVTHLQSSLSKKTLKWSKGWARPRMECLGFKRTFFTKIVFSRQHSSN